MSRKFKYVGPHDEVEIVRDGMVHGTVLRGHQIEIDDPEVSKGLDGSPDWEPVRAAKKSAANKTAAKQADPEPDNAPAAEPQED